MRLSSATPVSVVFRFCRLRTKRPAPKRSRKLSATCSVTRPLRRKSEPPAPAIDPTVSFSVVHGSGRLARSAGSRPKTTPVTSVSPNVNARMRASGSGRIRSGCPSEGTSAISARVSTNASARPAAPPANDNARLSTSSCFTRRPREAPSESRTAISFCRMNPRAMSRFATFAHAISSTRPTMHMSTSSAVEKSLRRLEKPIAAGSTTTVPFMNCSREYADQSFAAGSVIS